MKRIGGPKILGGGRGSRLQAEGSNYAIRDGIVVIPKGAVVAEGTVI